MERRGVRYSIRRARAADAGPLGEVHVRVWRSAYRGQMPVSFLDAMRPERRAVRWREDLAADAITTWVAEADGEIVGFAGSSPARDEDLAPGVVELLMINVLVEHAGRGVGRLLLGEAEAHWRTCGHELAVLWVLEANTRARRFYAHGGWRPDGTTRQFEVDGASLPELRLAKRLD